MQLNYRLFAVMAIMACATTFTSCKKEAKDTTAATFASLTIQSKDQSEVAANMDAVANDANIVLEEYTATSGRFTGKWGTICDATVAVDSTSDPRKVTITYDGNNCLGDRKRTGVVVLTMPASKRWKDAGTAITVTYQNLKVTRAVDSKSITLNGSHTVTNVNGGLLFNLAQLGTITHTITSNNMTLTFDDGTQRTWNVARKRVFTYQGGIVVTVSGTHTEGTNTNIAEWGTTRTGAAFTTSITQPLVIRQDCSFRLTSGEVRHEQSGASATSTFGLDITGKPTACPGTGRYYFNLNWTGPGGNSHNIILPY